MKLICDCCTISRLQPNAKNRAIKSTLAIGSHPPNKENAEYYILFFSTQNKTGQRYRIKDNILRVFTKFIADGKATISFKMPEHDVQLKAADPMQLKLFLQVLKMTMDGKKPDESKFVIPSVAAVTKCEPVKTKLVIRARGDYPIRGFPKTITHLEIIGIKACRVDSQVFQLKNLTHLDLSSNHIERIPTQLGNLPIQVLNLSDNKLSCAPSWKWLQQKEISSSLYHLSLNSNDLTTFPYALISARNLKELNLIGNKLSKIPFSIKALKSLRSLNLSSNCLKSVPSSLGTMKFEMLDLCGNLFQEVVEKVDFNDEKVQRVLRIPASLVDLAARVVMKKRLYYSRASMPWILVDILEESPCCDCGSICFDAPIFEKVRFMWFSKAQCIVLDRQRNIPGDHVFCSRKCIKSAKILA